MFDPQGINRTIAAVAAHVLESATASRRRPPSGIATQRPRASRIPLVQDSRQSPLPHPARRIPLVRSMDCCVHPSRATTTTSIQWKATCSGWRCSFTMRRSAMRHTRGDKQRCAPLPNGEMPTIADWRTKVAWIAMKPTLKPFGPLHATQAATLATRAWQPSDADPLYIIDDADLRTHYGPLIGQIASSHHWDIEDVASQFAVSRPPVAFLPRELVDGPHCPLPVCSGPRTRDTSTRLGHRLSYSKYWR